MKKLLLLGCSVQTTTLLERAKERGIYTIVTDNRTPEESPAKLLADEYWDIDVTDLASLEDKVRENGIDAVLAGASEFCTEYAMELCKKLKFPFYCEKSTWDICNNKAEFKKYCRECGVPVAQDYKLDLSFAKEDLEKISYPVVVKPADGWASIGVSICQNEEELKEGYQKAYDCSKEKQIIVEKYYAGDEVMFLFAFEDGEPKLITSFDYLCVQQEVVKPVGAVSPSRHKVVYDHQWKEALCRLFQKIGCKQGVGFVQFRYDGTEGALLEMNYRLPGNRLQPKYEKAMCDTMIDVAFGNCSGKNMEQSDSWNDRATVFYGLWAKPGKIASVEGVEQVQEQMKQISFQIMKKEGDMITTDTGYHQAFGVISFETENLQNVQEMISFVNNTLLVRDCEGKDMLYKYDYKI